MSQSLAKPPVWFWIVAGAALIWNIIGVMSFIGLVTLTPQAIAEMPVAEQALFENTPLWSTVAFAVGVFGGVFGCVFLLLRKNLAMTFFVASLVGVIAQFTYWLFMTDAVAVYGAQHAYAMPAAVTIIAIALVWFTMMAKGKGWIG